MREEIILNLLGEEIDKISKIARERKFSFRTEELIYPETFKDKLRFFIKSYRFFFVLKNSVQELHPEISKKISTYIDKFKDVYLQALQFEDYYKKDSISFGNRVTERNIKFFVIEHEFMINKIIDDAFPIGRMITLYDPEEAAGLL